MKAIFFTKTQGSGNDFLIIDNYDNYVSELIPEPALPEFIKKISNQHLGAGADGVIFLDPAKDYPFSMRYYNRDGGEANLCLNGARCLINYAYRLGIIEEKGKFLTASGPLGFFYQGRSVSIEVANPLDIKMNFTLTINKKKYRANYLRLGVPHCVIFVNSFDKLNIKETGEAIRNHKTFKPEGTNVNFVMNEGNVLFVRTYERGVEDETLSCGSGVLASAYIATKLFIVQSPVTCKTKGGELLVVIKDKLYLEGPSTIVYDGVFYI